MLELHQDPFLQWSNIPKHYQVKPLWETAQFINGKAFKPFEIKKKGLPIIKISELKNGVSDSTGFCDFEVEEKYLIDNGDILFAWSGNPSTSIDVFRWNGGKGILNQHIFKVIPSDDFDYEYYFYLLKYMKPTFVGLAKDQATSMGHVKVSDLKTIVCCYPFKKTQELLARPLSTNDQKIVLNEVLNVQINLLVQSVFKQYFVNKQDEAEAKREKWETRKLGDLINVKHGYAFRGENFSEQATADILVTPGNFKIGGGFKYDKLKYFSGDYPPSYLLKKNDLVVTMTDLSKEGDTLGYPGLIPEVEGLNFLHNQRIGKVLGPDLDRIKYWIYNLMLTEQYRAWILGTCTGSTVKHTSPTRIEEFEFLCPPMNLMEEFSQFAEPFYEKIQQNTTQSSFLHKANSNLLSSVINGEMGLGDI